MKPKIAVVDYSVGNIASVRKALEKLGASVVVTRNAEELKASDSIVLPGDGAFDAGMRGLAGLKETILAQSANGVPILGICLGMQLLFEKSEEGRSAGLSLLKGAVKRLDGNQKIPQIGWNTIEGLRGRLLEGVKEGAYAYFIHSYYCVPKDAEIVAAETEYGRKYASAIQKNNLFGLQFHPEKSSLAGLKMLENFLEIARETK